MAREFQILENIFAEERFSTHASWHFAICARDSQLPNVASEVGTIDVHYPCIDGDAFRATITLDVESLEADDPKPSFEQFRDSLLREFNVDIETPWYVGVFDTTNGVEDFSDRGVYT